MQIINVLVTFLVFLCNSTVCDWILPENADAVDQCNVEGIWAAPGAEGSADSLSRFGVPTATALGEPLLELSKGETCPGPCFMDSVCSNATPPQQRQVDEFSLSEVFPFGGMKPCGTEKPGSLCRIGDNLSTALTIYNATLLCYAPSTVIAGTVPVHVSTDHVSTDGVYFYTACINFDYHGYYMRHLRRSAPTRFALERTQVGSVYYLRHLRTCACRTRGKTSARGTRSRTDPHEGKDAERQLQQEHCLIRKEEQQAIANPPTLTYVYGGGPKKQDVKNTWSSECAALLKSFLQRVKRAYVIEPDDGHCGIRSMWRQDNSCGEFAKIDSEHIRKGRDKLAWALRNHSSFIVNLIEGAHGEAGCINPQEIEERAKLHLGCDASQDCDSRYYVGGFYGLDLIAWAIVTKRAVYMIRMDCLVDVYEPFKAPYAIELKDASPSEEVTVMVYTGNHFNRDFVVQNRNNQKTTYCAKVGLEDPEQTGLLQKPGTHQWNSSLVQKWNSFKRLTTPERYRFWKTLTPGFLMTAQSRLQNGTDGSKPQWSALPRSRNAI